MKASGSEAKQANTNETLNTVADVSESLCL